MGGGGSAVLERVPEKPVAGSDATHRVYLRHAGTDHVFRSSLRPVARTPGNRAAACDRGSRRRSGVGHATAGPCIDETRGSPGKPDTTGGAAQRERAADCQQLRHAVTAIDRQMRAGYSAREAPRLWERWREAKDRLHAAGCS